MIEYAAYALAAAGAYIIFMSLNVTAEKFINRLLFKFLPPLLGAVCLWFSAIVLVQV